MTPPKYFHGGSGPPTPRIYAAVKAVIRRPHLSKQVRTRRVERQISAVTAGVADSAALLSSK